MRVGDTVQIWMPSVARPVGYGTIKRISPTGKRVTVERPGRSRASAFYLRAGTDRYVEQPGSGLYGASLNDYFRAEPRAEQSNEIAR